MNVLKSDRIKFMRQINKYIAGSRNPFVLLGSIRFLLLLIVLGTPFLYKVFVDDVLISGQLELLWIVITGYVVSYIFETVLLTYSAQKTNRLSNLLAIMIRKKMWNNYLRDYNGKFQSLGTGELKNRIDNDVDLLAMFPDKHIIQYYYHVVLIVSFSIVMLCIDWKLALIGFVSIPLSFWMTKWLGKSVYRTSESYRHVYGRYEEWLKEMLQEWKEIKSFGLEQKQEIQFTSYWHQLSQLFFNKQLFWSMNRTFISIKDFFITKLNIYFVGGLLIIYGDLSIGSLVLFMSYYDLTFRSLGSVNELDIQLQEQRPSIERVLDSVDIEMKQQKNWVESVHFNGEISFKEVSYTYPAAKHAVLKNIQLNIEPGECVSIVGRSGSGKSTIAKILLGIVEPDHGAVWLNRSVAIHETVVEQINRNIGIVMQDSVLFNLSVKENLLLANPKASMDEIRQACRIAQIDTWVEGLPDQYSTMLGERGINLSGGQRQRLAIARVILQKPQIVVFDEATSQLDHESEYSLLRDVKHHLQGITLIIVTHRLQSVLFSDRTVLLDQGSIVISGKHDELLEKNHVYRNMFLQQKAI
ncbi:ABC transporter ATP-binding protein [Paenibacillus xylanilyticus]|uniref:ABC transporter ATP-binding protein n=1 Tax=Paenibacillus xylanilyticus TaxID=248903 RepID=UPI003AACF46F